MAFFNLFIQIFFILMLLNCLIKLMLFIQMKLNKGLQQFFILILFLSFQPTESSSAVPLIRQRTDSNASNGNESSISDADVQKRIQEVFNRKGYSNPDPSPNDSLEAQPDKVAVRIVGR